MCLQHLTTTPLTNLSEELHVPSTSKRLKRLVHQATLIHTLGFEGALRSTPLSPGYYKEGALHNGITKAPQPCCSLTLDAPTGNKKDDEWRCHTGAAAEALEGVSFHDDGQLPILAAGGGAAGGGPLAGGIHSLSLTHTDIPTNRSLTPMHLLHELGANITSRVLVLECRRHNDK